MLLRIKQLEEENSKMQSGFNAQRAKMKELFVQKERELNELKTKMIVAEVKAQEEISSLQQLVQGKNNNILKFFKAKLFIFRNH